MLGDDGSCFERSPDTLFHNEYRLTNIGFDNSLLCFASFENGIVETPYAILVDEGVKKVVVVLRGTRSLEDLVVDLQFIPEELTEVGEVCGFRGEGHHCHQGFLLRSKWMYNDIQRRQVLKKLFSPESPFKDYSLVICGHSLGAGCASILALMLKPAFSSLQCFAYEVRPTCSKIQHRFISKTSKLIRLFEATWVRL
jgi:sn1-specific diacylglycerol lipase